MPEIEALKGHTLGTPSTIEGPTFAKFWFQNTKPIITLPPSLLKCCIENKANIALHWAEIMIWLREGGFVNLRMNFFLSLLILSSSFPHHNLFSNVWLKNYINLFCALLCLQIGQFVCWSKCHVPIRGHGRGGPPIITTRGLPLSTYAQRGRGGVGPNAYVVYRLSQARLREFAYKGGRGVQKAGKSAYVLNGSPLSRIFC